MAMAAYRQCKEAVVWVLGKLRGQRDSLEEQRHARMVPKTCSEMRLEWLPSDLFVLARS